MLEPGCGVILLKFLAVSSPESQMHNRALKRRHKSERRWIALALICGVIGVAIYLFYAGNTDKWPETECTVTGDRVVRDPFVVLSHRVIVMYKGEFQLKYTVAGRNYYVWAPAGVSDPDQGFVKSAVHCVPDHCNFRIRYNPDNPSVAFAIPKERPR